MPSSFSPNLRIELIANGSQAGNWGNTTNTNLGTLVEQAISGYAQVQTTAADQAFTHADGASDQSRNAMIELSTTTGAAFNVYAPPSPKSYIIFNASAHAATIFNSTVIGNITAAGAGVVVPAGKSLAVFTDGGDFKALATSEFLGVLAPVNGGTGLSSPGTTGNVLTSNGTAWTSTAIPVSSTAQAEEGTNNTTFITPLRMREGFNASGTAPVFAARAWVSFDGTTTPPTVLANGNVSGVTRSATGTYQVTLDVAMPDANYAVSATSTQRITEINGAPTTSTISVFTKLENGSLINASRVYVVIFG